MALVTRCPNCATAFRVTAQHLQAHGGDVRCGHCTHVFNGFATLTTVQEPEVDDSSKAVGARTDVLPAAGLSDQTVLLSTLSHEITTSAVAPASISAVTQESAAEVSDTVNATLEHYSYDSVQPRKSQRGLGFASLFLLLLLVGQAAYSYRTEISVLAPSTRPYLEQYCELLRCTIPLSQQAELLSIESSDLQADFAQDAGVVILTATVRNYAPFPQAYPALELTLTDIQDQPLASRIFTPGEYLGGDVNPTQTIAPAHEVDIRLHLASSDLNAAGYRLFLLYP
ncbi:MAG: DUF3426 domain-containing protein [Nitrosomonadaceae bacterium]|nr:DUF3426 domain-containing protein [Nitrosomonadaceae bacterium]